MKRFIIVALLTLGLSTGAAAQLERPAYPPISFVVPSSTPVTVSEKQFVTVVIESAHISHDGVAIAPAGLIEYLNTTMQAEDAPYLAVHIREGVTYGDFVDAIDALRKTASKSIAVSMQEVPLGRGV